MESHPNAVRLHKHGFVDLVDVCATDLMVVNAARVSYGARSDWQVIERYPTPTDPIKVRGTLSDKDQGLISYLMRNKHGTPFEHNLFVFHVCAPIFVIREWQRHRIGVSYNEESARYTQLDPHFYIPERFREQTGKPGYYAYKDMSEVSNRWPTNTLSQSNLRQYNLYRKLLTSGVAKEHARLVLPASIYSQMYFTCNARSLMNFLELRNAPNAMQEIREYAQILERFFARDMPVTAVSFIENGYKAP